MAKFNARQHNDDPTLAVVEYYDGAGGMVDDVVCDNTPEHIGLAVRHLIEHNDILITPGLPGHIF
jgi:hypothetical protein